MSYSDDIGGIWEVGASRRPPPSSSRADELRALARAADERTGSGARVWRRSRPHQVSDAAANPSSDAEAADTVLDAADLADDIGGLLPWYMPGASSAVRLVVDHYAGEAGDELAYRYAEARRLVERWGQALRDCGSSGMDARAVEAIVTRLQAHIDTAPPLADLAVTLASLLDQSARLCDGRQAEVVLPGVAGLSATSSATSSARLSASSVPAALWVLGGAALFGGWWMMRRAAR